MKIAADPWRIRETAFEVTDNLLHDTLFTLGNGYIGLRGTLDEGFAGPPGSTLEGTYLNGFHDVQPISHPENAYGLARHNEFMLNVPNGKRIELWIEDERFDPLQGLVLSHERRVDFSEGVLRRDVEWQSPRGRRVRIVSERLVCLRRKHVYAIRYSVTPLGEGFSIAVVSSLDARPGNLIAGDDPRVGSHLDAPPLLWEEAQQDARGSRLVQRTRHSGFLLHSAVDHDWGGFGSPEIAFGLVDGSHCLQHRASTFVPAGQPACVVKYGSYFTTRDVPETELAALSANALSQARSDGFDGLCGEQRDALAAFWADADVRIDGDASLQQGVRFNQFHLLQSVGRDGRTNIAAKGVTGEGYEGHYFWDTEIYIFPFFLATQPQIARKLLEFRCALLPKARERARQMSHARGALYPWRTIAGEECSAYFPAGTAQYHINADIAHALKQYVEVTGDEAFLFEQGAEMLLETARIWMDLGAHDPRREGAFCIYEVTGPDEYSAMVDNNFYTNLMAQQHLAYAADVLERMAAVVPEEHARLVARLEISPDEPAAWRRAANAMYLPVDPLLGVHPQDDALLHKPAWRFPSAPGDTAPALLKFHPLVLYRHQVCKQADVVLALVLHGDRFDAAQKRRDFDFYESITLHDSSLSACIFGVLASEVGEHAKALDYFMQTARMDLDNLHGNTGHGAHMAAMAGAWLGIVHGFGGLRWQRGIPHFHPRLPEGWGRLAFRLRLGASQIEIEIGASEVAYRLLAGADVRIVHDTQPFTLTSETPIQQCPTLP